VRLFTEAHKALAQIKAPGGCDPAGRQQGNAGLTPPPRTYERGAQASYMQRSNNRQLLRHRGCERVDHISLRPRPSSAPLKPRPGPLASTRLSRSAMKTKRTSESCAMRSSRTGASGSEFSSSSLF
jgi:hypothetical protein